MTVILSDLLVKEDRGGDRGRSVERVITDVAAYERLAEATGGLLISAEKFDISEVAGIMGSVETSTVRWQGGEEEEEEEHQNME